jgi:hypothetical protein
LFFSHQMFSLGISPQFETIVRAAFVAGVV